MIRNRVPPELWDYGMRWVTETMSLTHTSAGDLEGCIPITHVTGETADISEYLDFGFYDEIWYKDNAGLSPYEPGRWLGVSHRTGGRLMCYHVLTQRGTVISRSKVTNLEKTTASVKDTFIKFDEIIQTKMKGISRGYSSDKPLPDDWADLIEEDEDFREEFQKIYANGDISEADDFTPEVIEDTYMDMEIALPRDSEGPQYARVTKQLRDANGIPIGTANDNPILDTRMYEVEYLDGYMASLAANTIAENLFAQVDEEGNRYVLMDAIADHRVDGSQLKVNEAFIKSSNGGQRRKETTKGWEILIQWKDGSCTWEALKDVKESYPVQLAEYAHQRQISNELAFAWWVPHVLKKRDQIISKVKSKYWQCTHKFGIRIPKTVEEARKLDRENGNTLCWDAICQEMKNVCIAFEEYQGNICDLPPGYQKINCHMIFYIKMGENFRQKARMVAGGHTVETPSSLTYSSVVSRDSVQVALMIAALNDLSVLACDIQNAYLTAPCQEKIWTIAGPEFGPEDVGKTMLVVRALYGLKTSGAAFRAFLAEILHDLGFTPSQADPDFWMRPAIVKENVFRYWEYVLCYVNDVLSISHKPENALKGIQMKYKLKGDKMAEPETYLGAQLSKMDNEQQGDECWTMSSDSYCAAMVKNVEERLQKEGLRLPSKCGTPLQQGYKPELDCTAELKADGMQWYQEMIGSLRWAIEIGGRWMLLKKISDGGFWQNMFSCCCY
jgi:Reverse transcriptase (RNA-dependent DNA polymerase).